MVGARQLTDGPPAGAAVTHPLRFQAGISDRRDVWKKNTQSRRVAPVHRPAGSAPDLRKQEVHGSSRGRLRTVGLAFCWDTPDSNNCVLLIVGTKRPHWLVDA